MSNFKFAHLLGLKKKSSEDESDNEDKSKNAKSRRAEEERDDEDAEDDDDREDMEDDDDTDPDAEGDDEDNGKNAKSRRAEEEDDDEKDDESRDVKKGRRAERRRCAAIFGSKHAAGRPDMAAHLAFNTRMSVSEAVGTLATMGASSPPVSGRKSLDSRMQNERVRLGPDGDKPATGKNALVSKMTSLYDKSRGDK
ncbi:hypothetical protein [Erwinia sp. S38]|uniref:hypothetical protein n=1 Tax=Erwinia sp. S38 TaxID=2769338 RepID=UPI00190C355E|nr:hypothetical protein [Erwinia sp. S38]MBK0004372.1 hypothetical protein [Erwinia sp. S38]